MRISVLVLGTFLQLAGGGHARADAIFLAGGRVIEGEATVSGDKVEVVLESGRISFPRGEVLRIEQSTSPLVEARRREAALQANDVPGMLQLADFCRDHALLNKERALLERIIAMQPDHADARKRLGYVREGQVWVDREELLRRAQLARTEDRQNRLAIAQQQAELALAQSKLETERAQLQRIELQRMELENEQNERRRAPTYGGYGLYAGGWYAPPLLYAGPRPPLSPPSGPPAFSIPGVLAPAQYFDGAFRR